MKTASITTSGALFLSLAITTPSMASEGPNLLVNGGFEDSVFQGCTNDCFASCWFVIHGWDRGPYYYAEDLVRNSNDAPCEFVVPNPTGGQYFVSLQGSICCECNNNGSVWQPVLLEPGRTYRAQMRVLLDDFDALVMSCGSQSFTFDGTNTPTGAWTTVYWEFVADTDMARFEVMSVGTPDAPGCLEADNAYIDELSLRQIDYPMQQWYARTRAPGEMPWLEDVNGDGRIDLVTLDDARVLRIALNQGSQLVDAQDIAMPAHGKVHDIVDMDADGKADLVFTTADFWDCGSNSISIYWNTGDPAMPFSQSLLTTLPLPPNDYCIQGHAIDFDGNGLRDVIVTNMPWVGWSPYRPSRTYRNLGARNFEVASDFEWPRDLYNVATTDIDGDGNADFLSMLKSGWADGNWGVWLFRGVGNGTFLPPVTAFVWERDRGGFVLDRNGSAVPGASIAVYPDIDPQSSMLVGTWNAAMSGLEWEPLAIPGDWLARQTIDFNNDSRDDIVLAGPASEGRLGLLLNDGIGGYSSEASCIATAPGLEFVKMARQPGASARSFAVGVSTSTIAVFRSRCTADLDGDGEVSGSDLGSLLFAWGSGGGYQAADLNGDGIVDGFDLANLLVAWGPCPE